MRTVLVTVDTPFDSVDVDLPADIPLREVLPELLGVLAIPPGALGADLSQLAMGIAGQPPFHLGRTLLDYQAMDGMRLRLDRATTWATPQRPSQTPIASDATTRPATPPAAPATPGGVVVRWKRETFGPGQD